MSTQQKVALVTGSSQGIGAGLVKAFRERNYRVIATSRSIKASDDPDILTVAGDIGSADTAKRLVSPGVAPSNEEQMMPIVTIQVTREGTKPGTSADSAEEKAALIKEASEMLRDVLNSHSTVPS